MFELDQFIADLRSALPDRSRLALKEVVARAVRHPVALLTCIGRPEKPGAQVLYRAPDLTVLNAIWAADQITLPHDHRMAAVIGMYAGREDNMFWKRVAHPTGFEITAVGGLALGAGDAAILGPEVIHSVVNPLGRLSGAIHVYDGDFLAVRRSMWNPETLTEERYDLEKVLKGRMPLADRSYDATE